MTTAEMKQIFEDTAYVRMGGSAEELKCAEYIKEKSPPFSVRLYNGINQVSCSPAQAL